MIELTIYQAPTPRAALVLAHGAGAGQASPFMVTASRGLSERGVTTATFDFGYMAAGRKVPDPAPVLERRWREAIVTARGSFGSLPLFVGGKSMGGRIASQVSAAEAGALAGLIFFGYPLHPPGKPQQRRDAHLPSIAAPLLFVQGARDAFGTASEIRALIPRLQRATLHEVADADHSLKVPARGGRSSAAVLDEVLDVVASWMERITSAE